MIHRSIPSGQIWFINTILQKKGPELLGEALNLNTGAGRDEARIFRGART